MTESKDIFFFGASGHALVILDALQSSGSNLSGYFDRQSSDLFREFNWLGDENEADIASVVRNGSVFPAVGSNHLRERLMRFTLEQNLNVATIIHPKAIVSITAEIDKGTYIGAGSVVNPLANIGKGCIINTAAVVEHECTIGDFTHIAPGAVLAGNVSVGSRTFIGANAVVKQGVFIGSDVVIGAGAVVLKNVPDGETWVGNPARKIN